MVKMSGYSDAPLSVMLLAIPEGVTLSGVPCRGKASLRVATSVGNIGVYTLLKYGLAILPFPPQDGWYLAAVPPLKSTVKSTPVLQKRAPSPPFFLSHGR